MEFPELSFILFFGVGFVKNVVSLILKPHTPEAIRASRTVHKKHGLRAIIAIARVCKRMTLDTIDAFAAPFTLIDVEAIVAILRSPYDVSVHAVFVVHASVDEIAISAEETEITVFGVLAGGVHDSHTGYSPMKDRHLLEERLGEIERNTIGERIPSITPPFLCCVNGEGGISIVHRDDFFTGEVARAVVEVEEIAE